MQFVPSVEKQVALIPPENVEVESPVMANEPVVVALVVVVLVKMLFPVHVLFA